VRVASSPVAILRRKLGAIPGVEEATSRFGAGRRLAWRAGRREIAHLHSDTVIDIRIPAARQRALPHDERLIPRDSTSDWIECRLIESGDAEYAVELIVQAARCARDK
jgi:hypothetical protein